MNPIRIVGAVALVAICCTLSACSTVRYENTRSVEPAKPHGPPPHAPAHGYRHKHRDVILVFDSALDVYQVHGRSNHYFRDKRYYRATAIGWETTTRLEGPWKLVTRKELPKGLRKSLKAKNKKNKKNK